jgi:hypothetical protein
MLRELVLSERVMRGREPKTTMVIMDSKSVKNTDTSEEKGHDGEKTSGIKVYTGVDTNGLPHAIRVRTAEVSNREGAIETLRSYAPNLSKAAKVLCDGGDRGELCQCREGTYQG